MFKYPELKNSHHSTRRCLECFCAKNVLRKLFVLLDFSRNPSVEAVKHGILGSGKPPKTIPLHFWRWSSKSCNTVEGKGKMYGIRPHHRLWTRLSLALLRSFSIPAVGVHDTVLLQERLDKRAESRHSEGTRPSRLYCRSHSQR